MPISTEGPMNAKDGVSGSFPNTEVNETAACGAFDYGPNVQAKR